VIVLQINGKAVQLEGPTPLLAYLEKLGVSPRAVAVEHNGVIVDRVEYATTTLGEGDAVEIVRMVGGGAQASRPNFSRIADSASTRSSHGSAPEAVRIERSWPLPASRTQSPLRAISMARRIAARRSITTS
jgi:sulfur carrier protein